MRIINCKKDQGKFDSLNESASKFLGCDRWCNPIVHPVTKEIAFTVKDRILPCLDGEEIIELTKDWFPKDAL